MSQLFSPINNVYPVFTYHKIEQHEDTESVPTAWCRFTNLLYCVKKISIMAIPAIPLLLGYTILTVMHWFEVHSIVTGTLIYPIVLVNYAAKEVGHCHEPSFNMRQLLVLRCYQTLDLSLGDFCLLYYIRLCE